MIRPQTEDIGRRVSYKPKHGEPAREGVLTSFSGSMAWVRFDGGTSSKATNPDYLTWLDKPDFRDE